MKKVSPKETSEVEYVMENGPFSVELFYLHFVLIPVLSLLALGFAARGTKGAVFPCALRVLALTFLCGHVGIFVGTHRCYSHGQCKPTPTGHWFFGLLASWAMQGPTTH